MGYVVLGEAPDLNADEIPDLTADDDAVLHALQAIRHDLRHDSRQGLRRSLTSPGQAPASASRIEKSSPLPASAAIPSPSRAGVL